jgi:ferredoxin-type protein NapF
MAETAHSSNRRAFLRGRSSRDGCQVRLPWLATRRFEDDCTRCGACLSACPENIITPVSGGFPSVDFSKGECTFCGACADACPETLFDRGRAQAWQFKAVISDACLAKRQIMCRSCEDACADRAIAFTPVAGRFPSPDIRTDRCTGCGACVSVCPENAIAIQ